MAHASRLRCRVCQLDFVGAFLQAKPWSRIFVTIPKIFGILFPEYAKYCGSPVRLSMSMYGMTLSGKYWYLDLLEYLTSVGFKASASVPCLFVQEGENGHRIFLLNYVDDMLYYGTCPTALAAFESGLKQRFNLELLGQAHWYLATRIHQHNNFDIELDQHRYCKSIVQKYLSQAGCKKVSHHHTTPLPADFVPSMDDCSIDESTAKMLEQEYNLDFSSCVGSLIYLAMTRCDICYAVNKLAKFTRHPGRVHFNALIHVLRYLRDNSLLGIRFYSEPAQSPLMSMISMVNPQQSHPLFGFLDSSWNDDMDTGRSTGCFLMIYMGGVIDHSSNLPNPVALSSAEAEYNEGCIAFMAGSHLRMLIAELEGSDEQTMAPTYIYFDSKSAVAMGASYKDTKHTRHILRRYHYVREGVNSKRFIMYWIDNSLQMADIGTKNNLGPKHQQLVEKFHVTIQDQQPNQPQIQEG